ncbi:MAG: cell division protein SepF [Gaiellaceae bacterium]|jgi:cell division inhibitor SepF
MGFADVWNRTLVYFGIAEEEDWDEDGYVTEEAERTYSERPNVRRLTPRRREAELDEWSEPEGPSRQRGMKLRPAARLRGVEPAAEIPASDSTSPARVHLVIPRSFNDAQQIADHFKQGIPVILNLQGVDTELSKRLVDFASGLTYALDGGMQRVADKVFLLTPQHMEVSAEERARMIERGFFNQA